MLPRIPQDKKVIICIGDADSGKTSLVRSIVRRLRMLARPVIHIDLDMGQSTIGPPTTIGLRDRSGKEYLYFVGNTSPYGVTGELKEGLDLFRTVLDADPDAIAVVDTPGLVSGWFGWLLAKMEITRLRADFAVVLDRAGESSAIVEGIRTLGIAHRLMRTKAQVQRKPPAKRSAYRGLLFEEYFRDASEMRLAAGRYSILPPGKRPRPGTLVGLLDRRGFLICLTVFVSRSDEHILVLAPPCDPGRVNTIKFGNYAIQVR